MNLFIAGADLVCTIISFVMILGVIISKQKNEKKYIYYMISIISLSVFCTADGLSYLMDEFGGNEILHFATNYMTFIGVDFILPSFVAYIWTVINEKHPISSIHIKIIMAGSILDLVLNTIGAMTGESFRIVNGQLEYGNLYDAITIFQLVLTIYFSCVVFYHRKTLSRKIVLTSVVFFIVPTIATMIDLVFPGFAILYVAITIVFLAVYIAIVSEEFQEAALEEKILRQYSYSDDLTGLYNRRAYEEDIEKYKDKQVEDDFVYLSMDVNELKQTNDNKGHAAGDELIVGATRCIIKCLGAYGKVYRTGGDEFTAIIHSKEEKLKEIFEDFEREYSHWRGKLVDCLTISYGYVTGQNVKDKTIHEISLLADKKMYEAKAQYYRKKGVDRRGQKEAHVALCELYTKILKINITNDTYQIMNMDESERTKEKGFSSKISTWLMEFGKSGQVHPEDLEDYLAKTSLAYMRDYFERDKTSLSIFYRRKYADGYKHVMMEIIPANDYSKDDQNLYLYVKSIDK